MTFSVPTIFSHGGASGGSGRGVGPHPMYQPTLEAVREVVFYLGNDGRLVQLDWGRLTKNKWQKKWTEIK